MREQNPTPLSCNKKGPVFSHVDVMANLLCFGRFAAGCIVNGCFFFTHYEIYIIDLITRLCSNLETVSLFRDSSRDIIVVLFEFAASNGALYSP